jgi:hypothetical protein
MGATAASLGKSTQFGCRPVPHRGDRGKAAKSTRAAYRAAPRGAACGSTSIGSENLRGRQWPDTSGQGCVVIRPERALPSHNASLDFDRDRRSRLRFHYRLAQPPSDYEGALATPNRYLLGRSILAGPSVSFQTSAPVRGLPSDWRSQERPKCQLTSAGASAVRRLGAENIVSKRLGRPRRRREQ